MVEYASDLKIIHTMHFFLSLNFKVSDELSMLIWKEIFKSKATRVIEILENWYFNIFDGKTII